MTHHVLLPKTKRVLHFQRQVIPFCILHADFHNVIQLNLAWFLSLCYLCSFAAVLRDEMMWNTHAFKIFAMLISPIKFAAFIDADI